MILHAGLGRCNENTMNESTDQSSHNLCDRWTGFMAASLVVLQILLERPSRNFYSGNRGIFFVVHVRESGWVGTLLNWQSSAEQIRSCAQHNFLIHKFRQWVCTLKRVFRLRLFQQLV